MLVKYAVQNISYKWFCSTCIISFFLKHICTHCRTRAVILTSFSFMHSLGWNLWVGESVFNCIFTIIFVDFYLKHITSSIYICSHKHMYVIILENVGIFLSVLFSCLLNLINQVTFIYTSRSSQFWKVSWKDTLQMPALMWLTFFFFLVWFWLLFVFTSMCYFLLESIIFQLQTSLQSECQRP